MMQFTWDPEEWARVLGTRAVAAAGAVIFWTALGTYVLVKGIRYLRRK